MAAACPAVSGQRQSYTVDKCQLVAAPHRETNNHSNTLKLPLGVDICVFAKAGGRRSTCREPTGKAFTQHAPFYTANHTQLARGEDTHRQSLRERNTTTREHKAPTHKTPPRKTKESKCSLQLGHGDCTFPFSDKQPPNASPPALCLPCPPLPHLLLFSSAWHPASPL